MEGFPEPTDKRVRTIVGQYQLGETIGRGTHGIVYKALDLTHGNIVAIKRIQKRIEEDDEATESFHKEMEFLKTFDHPHIVEYIDFVETEKHLNVIIEYVENGSLKNILQKFGALPEELVALYIHQVLLGLSYLHKQGVVHHDIKASNILLTKEGKVKLADFGISTQLKEDSDQKITYKVGQESQGSPFWMAPEIIKNEGNVTRASDIWSVGCTVIELLSGKPPFWDLGILPAMFAIVEKDHPAYPDHISDGCVSFLSKCFRKDPKQRSTVDELLEHRWFQASFTKTHRRFGSEFNFEKLSKNVVNYNQNRVANSNVKKEDSDTEVNGKTKTEKDDEIFGNATEHLNKEKIHSIQESFTNKDKLFAALHSNSLYIPGRRYIYQGTLTKICRRSKKKRLFFLFNDLLLYASFLPGSNNHFLFHRILLLTETKAQSVSDLPNLDSKFAFEIISREKSFIVLADDEDQKSLWIKAIQYCSEAQKKKATEEMDSGESSGSEKDDELAPVWVTDNAYAQCMLCNKNFGVFRRRRHHCRSCGRLICSTCSPEKLFLPNICSDHPVRVCIKCSARILLKLGSSPPKRITLPHSEGKDS